MNCLKICSWTWGFTIGTTAALTYLFYGGLFVKNCPTVGGRVCNDRGTCSSGYCVCDPQFSGDTCEDTMCPGYMSMSGEVCTMSGVCAEHMTYEMIPDECYQEQPSYDNGYTRKGQGWTSPECKLKIQADRQALSTHIFTEEQLFGTPTCQCSIPFRGEACDQIGCPMTVDGQICNGVEARNASVGFSRNDTRNGVGCQCKNVVNFLVVINEYSQRAIRRIQNDKRLLNFYVGGTCGTAYRSNKYPDVRMVIANDDDFDYKCYCNEKYYGKACEFGVCPEVEGLTCAGKGHPNHGFGAERGTTRSLSSYGRPCKRNCVKGKTPCPDCVDPETCTTKELKCPKERPWRCPSKDCVAASPRSECERGFVYGYLDDPEYARKTNYCTSFQRTATTYQQRVQENERVAFCSGDEGVMLTSGGFVPGGGVVFESPLVWYSMHVRGNGTLTLKYDDETPISFVPSSSTNNNKFHGTFVETRNTLEKSAFVTVLNDVRVVYTGLDYVEIRPSPFDFDQNDEVPDGYEVIRLTNDFVYVTMDVVGSKAEISTVDSDDVLANVTSTTYLRPYGSIVDLETCLKDLAACAWRRDDYKSKDGGRRLCVVQGRLVSSSDFSCSDDSLPPMQRVTTVSFAKNRIPENSIDLTKSEWNLQVFTPKTYTLEFRVAGGHVEIDHVEFVQANDLRRPCTCEPFGVNSSNLDRAWMMEDDRPPPSSLGQKAIGRRNVYGDSVLVRGVVTSLTNPSKLFVPEESEEVEVYEMKKLSELEYLKGVKTCNYATHPVICPNGKCATLKEILVENVSVNCTCTMTDSKKTTDCSCSDEMETVFSCSCTGTAAAGCDCDDINDHDFELSLFREIDATNGSCFLVRTTDVRSSFVETKNFSSENGSITFPVETFTRPLEFSLYPGCFDTNDVALDATSRLLSDGTVWYSIPFEISSNCTNVTTIVPTTFDLDRPFDTWRINLTTTQTNVTVNVTWAPEGIPICGTTNCTLSASSNENDVERVLWNDETYWRSEEEEDGAFSTASAFLRMDFEKRTRLLGAYVVFDTVGIKAGDNGFLNGSVSLQYSTEESADDLDRSHWITVTRIFDDVWHGKSSKFMRAISVLPEVKSVRLWSDFALGIRSFFPLTDQNCDLGTLLTDLDTIYVESKIMQEVSTPKRNDSETCIAEDTCKFTDSEGNEVDVTKDGICNDFKKFYWNEDLEWKNALSENVTNEDRGNWWISTLPSNPRLTQDQKDDLSNDLINGKASVRYTFLNDSWHVWYLNTTVASPTDYFSSPSKFVWVTSINETEDFTFFDAVTVVNETDGVQYMYMSSDWFETAGKRDTYSILSLGNQTFVVDKTTGGTAYYQQIPYRTRDGAIASFGVNVCYDGTDWSDCGPSNRLGVEAPKLKCAETEFELRLSEDASNRSSFELRASLTLTELLDSNVDLRMNTLRLSRAMLKLSRGSCGDCDGSWRCGDGSCVERPSECASVPTYDCPGDGCVRANVNLKEFKCACQKGYSGLDCGVRDCVPIDYKRGRMDPHAVCSCSGPPPLKIRPPFSVLKRKSPYTRKDILRLNRVVPRKKYDDGMSVDVGWVNVRPERAPYGVAFFTTYQEGNRTVYTNCPPMVRTPLGKYVTMEECIKTRSPVYPYPVIEWVDFPTSGYGNETVQIKWENELSYDEAPFRCPSTAGHCVPTAKDCYMIDRIEPACGGHGRCLADSTCECNEGTETFHLTPENTAVVDVPYYNVDGDTNPIRWGIPNPSIVFQRCNARNCTEVDCSAPYGCFAGTVERNFLDKRVTCDKASGHPGMCATDHAACARGDVESPKVCSGNGILRKVDYRDEWICVCGTPKSKISDDPRETVELEPNGYGGPRCSDYYCPDDPTLIYFSWVDPDTGTFYKDVEGNSLPGIWKGPCGAPVGPSVDDSVEWASCCPGLKRLEQCTKVVCVIGGVSTCVDITECSGQERTPKVYPCNGKGTVRGDGSCECNADRNAGTTYTYDLQVFSYKGCFKQKQCALAPNGEVCNDMPANDAFKFWPEFPPVPFYDQQALVLATYLGLPPTNKSVIMSVVNNLDAMDQLVQSAYVNLALSILAEQRAAQSDICIWNSTDTDSANPIAMVPYVGREAEVGPYLKAFKSPYAITPETYGAISGSADASEVRSVLSDGIFVTEVSDESRIIKNLDYLELTRVSGGTLAGSEFTLTFNTTITIAAVRLHVRYPNGGGNGDAHIRFYGDSGVSVCGDVNVPESKDFRWAGSADLGKHCLQEFFEYRFDLKLPEDYSHNCKSDVLSEGCTSWMDEICETVPNAKIRLPGSLDVFLGCPSGARCCIPLTQPFSPTSTLRVSLLAKSNVLKTTVQINELTIFGYGTKVVTPFPEEFDREIEVVTGGDNACITLKWLRSPAVLQQENLDFFRFRNWTSTPDGTIPEVNGNLNHGRGREVCELAGGTFASSRQGDGPVAAQSEGETCFGESAYEKRWSSSSNKKESESRGCFVNARNRREIKTPKATDFIENSCLKWGCYMRQPSLDFYSTPEYDDGQQWKSSWGTQAVTWKEWLQNQLNMNWQQSKMTMPRISRGKGSAYFWKIRRDCEKLYAAWDVANQYNNCVNRDVLNKNNPARNVNYDSDWLENYYVNGEDSETKKGGMVGMNWKYWKRVTLSTISASNNDYTRKYDFVNNYELHTIERKTEIPPNGPTVESKFPSSDSDAVVDYWTNPEICVVMIYSCPNCNSLRADNGHTGFYNSIGGGHHKLYQTDAMGSISVNTGCAFKKFVVTPKDDYSILYKQLSGYTYDECRDGETECSYRGNKMDNSFRPNSFSVQGPCKLKLNTGYDNVNGNGPLEDTDPDGTFYAIEDRKIGTMTHSHKEIYAIMEWSPFWQWGCSTNMVSDHRNDEDKKYNDPFPGYDLKYAQDGSHWGLFNGNAQIVPLFDSKKVRVTLKVPKTGKNTNEDNFYMGWDTHPFMCATVKIETLMEVRKDGIRYKTEDDDTKIISSNENDPITYETVSHPEPYPIEYKYARRPVKSTTFPAMDESTYDLVPCDSDPEVMECTKCPVEQPFGDWQWNQRFYNPDVSRFATEMSRLRQTEPGTAATSGVSPVIHVTFSNPDLDTVDKTKIPISNLSVTMPDYYARLISVFTITDYSDVHDDAYRQTIHSSSTARSTFPRYYLDNCVRVTRGPNAAVPYVFDTAVCEDKYRVLCVRDYLKYAVQDGRQGKECGPLSCTKPKCPGQTVFDLHPKASREKNPFEYSVLDAYLNGELTLLTTTKNVNWDAAMEYLKSTNQSIAFAMRPFRDALYSGVSTRPGRESRGARADPKTWIDADFKRAYPVDCGIECLKTTGRCMRRVAISREYCDPNGKQFVGAKMSPQDYPTILLPVPETVDAKYEGSCGSYVNPANFHKRDGYGAPAPDLGDFRVLEEGTDYVVLKANKNNGTWRNTGKRQNVVYETNVTYWFTGKLSCGGACRVSLWTSAISTTYGDPSNKTVVGTYSVGTEGSKDAKYEYEWTVPSNLEGTPIQILGWDVDSIEAGKTLKLGRALVTDLDTITKCRNTRVPTNFVELPSSLESPSPRNVCPYTESEALDLSPEAEVGTCFCTDSSPYGGRDCTWPTTISFKGKHVCNGFGDEDSLAVAPDGSIVPVIAEGVYEYGGSRRGCKCLDLGKIIQTRFRPSSVYDFDYVVRYDKLPNQDEFIEVTDIPEIDLPVTQSTVEQSCASQSAILPSFVTSDEVTAYKTVSDGSTAVFLDMDKNENLDLRWKLRNSVIKKCNETLECGEAIVEACDDSEVCKSLNWNNLVFNRTGDYKTDGKNASQDATAEIIIDLIAPTTDVLIELWSTSGNDLKSGTPLTASASSDTISNSCTEIYFGPDPVYGPSVKYACAGEAINQITLTRTPFGTVPIREIRVYQLEDEGRPVGVFD